MKRGRIIDFLRHSFIAAIMIIQMPLVLRSDVSRYSGDGEIRDISFRYLIWNVKGYKIDFDEFPLNEPMCSEYRLENLPHIRKIVGLYFKVCGVGEKSDIGTLKFEVRDDNNNMVAMMTHRPLKDLIWSKDSGDPCFYIYELETMEFMPEKGMHYKLSFEFIPKVDSGDAVGSLYIRCGGSL